MYFEVFSINVLLIGILFPLTSFAQIQITEIMYDREGSDTGYEWVEIINSSDNDIDISQWYFFENETHHGLYPDGFSILGPNERGLIVQNIENIYSEYGNNLNLIKSSFSLNNTGESLSMSDENKTIQETVTYSSNDGATGNGNSLQWTGSFWVENIPTPGVDNLISDNSQDLDENESSDVSNDSSSVPSVKNKKEDYYTAVIDISGQALAYSPIEIDVYVYHTKNGTKTKLKRGIYYLNFGDGSVVESDERFEIQHVYNDPGKYELVFEFYTSKLSRDSGEDPKTIIQKTLKVVKPLVEISAINNQSTITLVNNTSFDVNLEGWDIAYKDKIYVFPRNTIITAGNNINIQRTIHKLGTIYYDDWIRLRNKGDRTLYSFSSNKDKMNKTLSGVSYQEVINNDVDEFINLDTRGVKKVDILDRFLEEYPGKERVYFENKNDIYPENKTEEKANLPVKATFITGIIALFLAGARAFIKNKKKNIVLDKDNVIGEIELIE